ncbi:hypothetical protein KL86SPO_70502 [uncultured Sporomusa sp.]|uniref:Uncharacterized protein n=1 Tax=uncultured Sporomusa sp. TaxID=307249 RepID=A0A212M1E9_9FIRM|nr:hypothetical protein KL86SPO_70502 [uncultured Sporomusa sp.]
MLWYYQKNHNFSAGFLPIFPYNEIRTGIEPRPKLNKEVSAMRLKTRWFSLTVSSEFALIICWIIEQLNN